MTAEPSRHQARGEGIDAEASTAIVDEDVPDDVLLYQAELAAREAARRDFTEAVDAMPQSLVEASQRVETVLRYEAERVYDRMSQDMENPLGPSAVDDQRYDLLSDAVEKIQTVGLAGLSETEWKHVPEPLRGRALRWAETGAESVSPRPDARPGRTELDGGRPAPVHDKPQGQQRQERTMTQLGKKTVQGNLTGDPRKMRTKAGQELVVFKMAENHRRFNEDSRAWEDTDSTFYDVAVDRAQLRQNVLASLHKGDRVTVTGDYRVGAYSTSTGQPGLNHRIWADDVAASMQYNPVTVLPRDHHRDEAGLASAPEQSVDRAADQGLRPEQLTPEAYAAWSAQQPVTVPGAQQPAAGLTR